MENIRNKLKDGKSLSTKDWEKLGYSFESFLRYAQISDEKRQAFHLLVLNNIKTIETTWKR